ncbi:MAG: hypothetical protein LBQ54_14130 [Planctomycetaceae bacterium]|nr:hypothetical protein [Planctomycetaceae bacterium]
MTPLAISAAMKKRIKPRIRNRNICTRSGEPVLFSRVPKFMSVLLSYPQNPDGNL